ncbi:coxsackievirus and adenovirus receptor homolog [Nerophis ophidion]|uniref:coxsackievirus and adenovirus receptor homolog n=1 Tax=Nerophis ophidion TaxID=159077 RepID=UPI002ADFC769|nr:coxsackievirus and adenovirus receptor homolog [Nerophis ophidion]
MEKLSTPVCAVEGEPVGSNDVTLKCKSSRGTPPLTYSWTKTSGNQKMPPKGFEDTTGENLFVKRISEDNCGRYRCTVKSLLDTKHCEIQLKCPSLNKSDATNYSEIQTVMEELSTPVCAVEGEPVGNNDVTLKCKSSQGTPPLTYSWTKTSGNQKMPPKGFEDTTGENLFVKRISEDNCGRYRCTVKSLLDTKHCEIQLKCPSLNKSDATNYSEIQTVMEELSTPVCAVEEKPVGNNDVTLKCKSSRGTPPLTYSWTKTSGNQKMPPNAIEDTTGENLFVKRISEDNCGRYRCTVESLLDTKHCEIQLKCPLSNKSDATNYSEILLTCPESPAITSNGNKVITAVAVTVVLLLAIVFVLSFWSLRKKRGELVINETVTE